MKEKEEKIEREGEERERERKRKGKRCSDGQNSSEQEVKSVYYTRATLQEVGILPTLVSFYPLSYCFGLLLGPLCAMVMAYFLVLISKTCVYGSFQNVPATLEHTIAWIGAIVWPLLHSNFGRSYLSRPNSN